MPQSALSHDRAARKAASIAGERQLAFLSGSNETVIHHVLYLLNNVIECVHVHTVAGVAAHVDPCSLCKEVSRSGA